MTLCLAAEGWLENGRPCIAFCCDTGGAGLSQGAGSDSTWKLREIGSSVALLSGAKTSAEQLLALCDKTIANLGVQKFGDESELAVDRFLHDLRTHAGERKRTLIEHWMQFNLGISFDYFLKHHKEQFHPEHTKEIWKEIQGINLEADIIICGFQDDHPVIARMDRYGNTFWEHNYAAVGAGADAAHSFLAQRDWDEGPTMWQCVHYLFQAKQMAQQNQLAGTHTRISVLMPDIKNYVLKFEGSEKPGVKLSVQWKATKPGFKGGLLEILIDKPVVPPPPVAPPVEAAVSVAPVDDEEKPDASETEASYVAQPD